MRNTKIPQTQHDKMLVAIDKEKCSANPKINFNIKFLPFEKPAFFAGFFMVYEVLKTN